MYYFGGTGIANGHDAFVRGGIGRKWALSSWILNADLGLSIKVSNRDEELDMDDNVFLIPFGLGVHYAFDSQ